MQLNFQATAMSGKNVEVDSILCGNDSLAIGKIFVSTSSKINLHVAMYIYIFIFYCLYLILQCCFLEEEFMISESNDSHI